MEGGKILAVLLCLALFLPVASAREKYDVIVVRSDIPTDYVVAAVYAATTQTPLVSVKPDSMGDELRNEFAGYSSAGFTRLLIIGGREAISTGVENELSGMGFLVSRLWDWNRQGTAARVAVELWGDSESAVFVNGSGYENFLIAERLALEKEVPILFTKSGQLTDETRDAVTKLGLKKAMVFVTDAAAADSLRSMGISVSVIEPSELAGPGPENAAPDYSLFYYGAAAAGIVALAAVLVYTKKRSVSAFLLAEDEERIVSVLRTHGKVDQNRLAGLLDVSRPKITRMLRRLEDRGIIEREKFKKTFRVKLKRKMK